METKKVSLARQINEFFQEGAALYNAEFEKKELSQKEAQSKEPKGEPIQHSYQTWYTKALPVVKQILPDRYQEFIDQYKASEKRKEINSLTYTISDYMIALQVTRG